jgi:hypothetical protein
MTRSSFRKTASIGCVDVDLADGLADARALAPEAHSFEHLPCGFGVVIHRQGAHQLGQNNTE